MLDRQQSRRLTRAAYLPEHLPHYVTAVADLEPLLWGDYLCYVNRGHLQFIGYPLSGPTAGGKQALDSAIRHHHPRSVAVIAPDLGRLVPDCRPETVDQYFRIDLPVRRIDPKVAYMVRRAQKELTASEGAFGDEHGELVELFLRTRTVSEAHRRIFRRLRRYLEGNRKAFLLEARRDRRLVAFSIVDGGSSVYAFYMFHFRSPQDTAPGASDMLFAAMLQRCERMGKQAINLGLGMNAGNRHFKEKWGGKPFLPYQSVVTSGRKFDWRLLLEMMKHR
jgi:hypothetical protein